MYVTAGRYCEQIGRFLQYFPREKLLILLFEDIIRDQRKDWKTSATILMLIQRCSRGNRARNAGGQSARFQRLNYWLFKSGVKPTLGHLVAKGPKKNSHGSTTSTAQAYRTQTPSIFMQSSIRRSHSLRRSLAAICNTGETPTRAADHPPVTNRSGRAYPMSARCPEFAVENILDRRRNFVSPTADLPVRKVEPFCAREPSMVD